MNSGHNTISESTTVYNGSTGVTEIESPIKFSLTLNPVNDYAFFYFDPSSANNITGELYNANGQLLEKILNLLPSISYTFNFSKYASGSYFIHFSSGKAEAIQKILILR